MKSTLSVIILTRDEQLHIRRCIERIRPIATEIFVVDSCSTDGTQAIARSLGATVVEHPWPGLYAVQLNWASTGPSTTSPSPATGSSASMPMNI